jgi:ABC-type transporter Mla subunit MlaD
MENARRKIAKLHPTLVRWSAFMDTNEIRQSVTAKIMEAVAELDQQINELTTMRQNLLATLNPPKSTMQVTGSRAKGVLNKAREILERNGRMSGQDLAKELNVTLKTLYALASQEAKKSKPRIKKVGTGEPGKQLFVAA